MKYLILILLIVAFAGCMPTPTTCREGFHWGPSNLYYTPERTTTEGEPIQGMRVAYGCTRESLKYVELQDGKYRVLLKVPLTSNQP